MALRPRRGRANTARPRRARASRRASRLAAIDSLCQRARCANASRLGPATTSAHPMSGMPSASAMPAGWPRSRGTLEKVTAASTPRASRLMSVCEKTVPATTGSRRRLAPSRRRASTTTRVGSPMRPGNKAEAITPIIVARTTGAHAMCVVGSAARRVWCQENERMNSDSPIRTSAKAIHPGDAVMSACQICASPSFESAKATRPASTSAARPTPTRLCRRPRSADR